MGLLFRKIQKKYLNCLDYDTYMKNPNIEIYWKKRLIVKTRFGSKTKEYIGSERKIYGR